MLDVCRGRAPGGSDPVPPRGYRIVKRWSCQRRFATSSTEVPLSARNVSHRVGLLGLADGLGGLREREQRPQEPLVGRVVRGDRAAAVPARAAQRVETRGGSRCARRRRRRRGRRRPRGRSRPAAPTGSTTPVPRRRPRAGRSRCSARHGRRRRGRRRAAGSGRDRPAGSRGSCVTVSPTACDAAGSATTVVPPTWTAVRCAPPPSRQGAHDRDLDVRDDDDADRRRRPGPRRA